MNRLLITGGSGFVGGHICKQALDKWDIQATYRTRSFSIPGVHAVKLDLADERQVERAVEKCMPHTVIHTAAWSDLERCEGDPQKAFHINATATEILAELSRRFEFRLIFISSDMVFDGRKGSYTETDSVNPLNVYGHTKLAAERFIQTAAENFVIARSALVYGPPVTGVNSFSETLKKRVGKQRKPMPLFTDEFRSPVLVQSLAACLLELAENNFNGIIHLGGASGCDRYSFARRMADLNGWPHSLLKPVSMKDISFSASRPADTTYDISLAQQVLSTPLPGFFSGLEQA